MSLNMAAQGKAMLEEGKKEQALDLYQSVISRDPNNARAWNGAGVCYELLGRKDEAERAYSKALNIVPGDMIVSNNLARFYLEKGEPSKALELLEPFDGKDNLPKDLVENLSNAKKRAGKTTELLKRKHANLGIFPTSELAAEQVNKVKNILNDKTVSFNILPRFESKGNPVFVLIALGTEPETICSKLVAKGIPCDLY